jgi:hypothetical protein
MTTMAKIMNLIQVLIMITLPAVKQGYSSDEIKSCHFKAAGILSGEGRVEIE